jgi:hypothetical protein
MKKNPVFTMSKNSQEPSSSSSSSKKKKLLEEIKLLKKKISSFEGDKGEGKTSGKRKFDITKLRCHSCHELGHFSRECPKKKSKKNSEDGNQGKVSQE